MLKKSLTSAAIAASLLASLGVGAYAQAREGATSVGHGVKCYFVLGTQVCFRGP